MAIVKLTKKAIDEKVLRFLEVNEALKKLKKEADSLKSELEGQYIQDAKVKELISGMTTEFEKIPVNNSAHVYLVNIAKPYIEALGMTKELIKTVTTEVLDVKKFEKLCPEFLPEAVLKKCRVDDNWTFKSAFRRKEAVTQKAEKATKAKASKVEDEIAKAKAPRKSTKKAAGQ